MILLRIALILLTSLFFTVSAFSQGMVIGNNANISISQGITMSINNANCTIISDTIGTGALVDRNPNGNVIISGSASVERYILRGNSIAFGTGFWHYVSSPVTNQPIDMNFVTSNNVSVINGNYDFYLFDEPENIWRKFGGPTFNDTEFVPGKGYAIVFDSDGSCVFTGTTGTKLNTGIINMDLTRTAGSGSEGFNLVGNPYPSPFSNADFVTANSSSIEGTLYYWSQKPDWDNREDNYSYWNVVGTVGNGLQSPDDYTAVGQAFMVTALADNTLLTFSNSMRATGDPVYLKEYTAFPRLWLCVTDKDYRYNETLIAFLEGATLGFDNAYDARKLNEGGLLISTWCQEETDLGLAIQSLPPIGYEPLTITIDFSAQVAGLHEMKLKHLDNWDPVVSIILEDRETGKFYDLLEESECSVTIMEPGNYNDRFLIHFNASIDSDKTYVEEDVLIYSFDSDIYVKYLKHGLLQGELEIYNVLGQLIHQERILQSDIGKYTPKCQPGYYIVRLISAGFVTSKRVYVR